MPKEMTREEVLAEREARKKAKLAKKKPKENNKIINDVGNNVPKMNPPVRKSVTDGCVESPAPIPKTGQKCVAEDTSSKESVKSGLDHESPRDGPKNKNITNKASPGVGRKSVTDCAVPGTGRKSVTDGASPRVNDQVDGCILRTRQPFQDFSDLTPEMVQKKLNSPGYNFLIDTGSYLVKDANSVINELISGTTQSVKSVTEPVKSTEAVKNVTEVKSTTEPVKSKAELKAERRAKQEAQRAAKAAAKTAPVKPALKPTEMKPAKSAIKKSTVKTESEGKSKSVTFASYSTKQASQNKIKLFSHLYREKNINYKSILNSSDLHPAVVGLGVQYSNRVIAGSNARCVALLYVLKQMFSDYKTPAEKEFSRGFEAKLEPAINYLNQCRPISVSMTNALKHIKWHLTQLPNNITDAEGRLKMSHVITTYIKEQIEVAGKAISLFVQKKIANGDVILTFGCSSLVERILKEAHEAGVDFSVVIIDSAPWFEGKEMLRRLVKAKIPCTYVLISAASFIMKQASKVLLGAHALLANGCVMSRSGTALVALLANTANVPVLVCCETHKFSERVQTDAFVYNELGDPDELVSSTSPVNGWESNNYLVPLSLVYDVTPPDLVTAVVTELAILPCTSVPVILRVKPTESA